MQQRYEQALKVNAIFFEKGYYVYSPIAHTHVMAQRYTLPTDFAFWRGCNIDYIRRSAEFWVFMIEGWDKSVGVAGELAFAIDAGLEIKWVTPCGKLYSTKEEALGHDH